MTNCCIGLQAINDAHIFASLQKEIVFLLSEFICNGNLSYIASTILSRLASATSCPKLGDAYKELLGNFIQSLTKDTTLHVDRGVSIQVLTNISVATCDPSICYTLLAYYPFCRCPTEQAIILEYFTTRAPDSLLLECLQTVLLNLGGPKRYDDPSSINTVNLIRKCIRLVDNPEEIYHFLPYIMTVCETNYADELSDMLMYVLKNDTLINPNQYSTGN